MLKWFERERMGMLLAVALFSYPAAATTLLNPSFEAGPASGPADDWNDTSTTAGFVRCSVAGCGTGSGTTGPFHGEYWAWLGGTDSAEISSISQNVLFPLGGPAFLHFYLWPGEMSGNANDFFAVRVDGSPIYTVAGDSAATGGYSLVSLNLGIFADGGLHNIEFYLEKGDTANMNVSVDLASLDFGVPEPGTAGLVLLGLMGAAAGRKLTRRARGC